MPIISMKSTLFFSLLLTCLSAHANPESNPVVDSLKRKLSSTREDTHRVKVLNALSSAYRNTDPEQGILYGTRGLELARRLHWNAGIAKAHYYRGGNYLNAAKLPEALDDCLQAVRVFELCKDYTYMSGAYSNIGGIYFYQGKTNQALTYFEKALDMERRMDPGSTFEVAITGNMGIMYQELKDYPKALKYLHHAVGISDSAGRSDELPNPYSILAEIHLQLKHYDSTLSYVDKTMTLARQYHNELVLASALRIRGQVLLEIVRSGSEQQFSFTSGQTSRELLQNARLSLDSAVAMYQSLSGTNLLALTYGSLSDLEEFRGNLREALTFQKNLNKSVTPSILMKIRRKCCRHLCSMNTIKNKHLPKRYMHLNCTVKK